MGSDSAVGRAVLRNISQTRNVAYPPAHRRVEILSARSHSAKARRRLASRSHRNRQALAETISGACFGKAIRPSVADFECGSRPHSRGDRARELRAAARVFRECRGPFAAATAPVPGSSRDLLSRFGCCGVHGVCRLFGSGRGTFRACDSRAVPFGTTCLKSRPAWVAPRPRRG